jgi:outer membrane protein
MLLKLFISLSLMAIASSVVIAANLSEVYRLARANDAVFSSAQATYTASLEKLPQGRALLRPSVILTGNLRENESNNSGSFSSNQYALSLTQPIYRKQDFETYEQAKLQVLQAEQTLKVEEQSLQLRVAQAYFAVLQAQDVLATSQTKKQAFAEQLAQARKSFEVGASTITDTHEAQARYDLATAEEIEALNELEVQRRTMEKIINSESPDLAGLRDDVNLTLPEPNYMDAWVKQAESDSLFVVLGQTAQESARREVLKQKGGHLPTLNFVARHAGGTKVDDTGSYIGLDFALPIYKGGGVDSLVRESVALQEKTRHNLESARRQARLDARQGFLGVVSGSGRVKALEQALVSSEAQLKSTKLGLEVGVRTRVDVLNAQQQLFTTKRDLAAARYQTLVAGLQLKAAAGSLKEDDLKAVDALLK